ncbi:MAG TPA: Rpn family recombination-promoting nuclease/putative transposase [Humisphaera sp.]|nr:Rpn family recombination-promoting nuclease/putative transposase [Humisphaera sp.]
MILGIDPKVDYAFKYMLGRDSTRAILIDVLNKVLDSPAGHEIQDVELLNPFNLQETLDDKLSILDLKARDQSGRQFNVEMQMLAYPDYEKRVVYYWSKFHQQQLHEGDDYGVLAPTISISFLNHVLFPQVPDHHLRFHLLEDRHHFAMSEDIEFHVLELPKFTKTLAELESGLDIWLYFLRFAEKIDAGALPTALQRPSILRAVEELKMLTQTDIERERYESRRKAQLDHDSAMGHARRQGELSGEIIGEKIGAIHAYERMLHRPRTLKEHLLTLSLDDLTRLADDLERQALNQE